MEKKRICYLFVFEGYADWEPALAISGLNKYSDVAIKTFSVDGTPVRSMGDLSVDPDLAMSSVTLHPQDILLLPGGDKWEEGGNLEIIPLVEKAINQENVVAAICGATIALATMGVLDSIDHTSNGEEYLGKFVSQYKGGEKFKLQPAVVDKNVLTSNGAAMIEFAYELFILLRIMPIERLKQWLQLYKSAGMDYKP